VLWLVNINQVEPRTVILQAGGYGEHRFTRVARNGREESMNAPYLIVRLEPGAGEQLVVGMQRYVHPPTLAHPWDR